MAESIFTDRRMPEYWSIEPRKWEAWVAAMGITAASKLAGACLEYFFHGYEPDATVKLTKVARGFFEAERAGLDRRRASALNGAKGRRGDVEKSEPQRNRAKESRKTIEETAEKPDDFGEIRETENREEKSATTSAVPAETQKLGTHLDGAASTPPDYQKQKQKLPQTPAPGQGARGLGTVSPSELEALLDAGLGFTGQVVDARGYPSMRNGWRAVS